MQIENRLKRALQSKNEQKINKVFEEIYNMYINLICFCISKYVFNSADVEELAEDVFINFFNHLENFDETKNIKYYITISAKNIAINFLKKKKIEYILDDNLINAYEDSKYKSNSDDATAYQHLLNEMRRVLNVKEIKIILDHQIYGLQFKEIALNLNESVNTTKSIYRRAIKKFKENYKGGFFNE